MSNLQNIRIAAKEKEVAMAESDLAVASGEGKFTEVNEINSRYESLKKEVEVLFARWECLDAKGSDRGGA